MQNAIDFLEKSRENKNETFFYNKTFVLTYLVKLVGIYSLLGRTLKNNKLCVSWGGIH